MMLIKSMRNCCACESSGKISFQKNRECVRWPRIQSVEVDDPDPRVPVDFRDHRDIQEEPDARVRAARWVRRENRDRRASAARQVRRASPVCAATRARAASPGRPASCLQSNK